MPSLPTLGLRPLLANALRSRVAGPDAEANAARIWAAPGHRAFTPADPIWRVHADASMFVGGIRALLLQSTHPLAMAAVAAHSGYRGDPWGRLARTSTFIAATTFGPEDLVAEQIATVRAVHARIAGQAPDGRAYRADDPLLLRWVHIAEIDSFLRAYQRFARHPLTAAEADQYVAQTADVATRLGAATCPKSVAELRRHLQAYRPVLEPSDAATDTARFLLRTPPVPAPARPGYMALASAAVALLPAYARRLLGLPHPGPTAPLARLSGAAAVHAIRWAMTEPRPGRDVPATPRPAR